MEKVKLEMSGMMGNYHDGIIYIDWKSLAEAVFEALGVEYDPNGEVGPCKVNIEVDVVREFPYPKEGE